MTGPDVGATVAFADYARDVEALRKQLADAQATVEALQAIIKQMGEQAARLAKDGMAAKAQVEALQRERDEAIATALKEGIRSGELQAALDAERANRESLEACVDRDVKKIKDLQTQLSQLQALVRAMSKDFHLEDMRKAEAEAQKWEAEGDMYGWNFHQGRASGIREEQSIVYRIMREHGVDPMKALDATTPAPRQRQVHSCEIPGCVSCANPEEGGDGE